MRILFWSFVGFDRHITSEHLLIAVIEQLCKQGHKVHILQKYTGGELPSIPEQLLKFDITTDIVPFSAAAKSNFIKRYLIELKYIIKCRKYFSNDYDAVFIQSNNVAGFAIKEIRRHIKKAIVTLNIQDIFPLNAALSGTIKRGGFVYNILSCIQRYAYKHCDNIITISDDMKETLTEDGVNKEKISVIYNWSYEDNIYDNLDLSPVETIFKNDTFNVVYAGNIGVMQNVNLLIETANLMKNDKSVLFYIIGDGVYKKRLINKVEKYNINNVVFLPMQTPQLAPVIYSAADINVIPLAKDIIRTALPSKTATCLACNKPIIFAIGKNSKFANQVNLETGSIIIEPDDPEELVNSIYKIKNDEYINRGKVFFYNHCVKSINSIKYATIITSKPSY